MKKSLLAVALLGTFAASAFAAPSVTLYGRVDTGLVYAHTNNDTNVGFDGKAIEKSSDVVSMESGFTTGSRWGLKGTEDLGNAKVGFILENGFTSDDGADAQPGRMFGREAAVTVSGAYGMLYAGRGNTLASDGGTLGMLGATSTFGNAYGAATMKGSTGSAFARYDNVLAYVSPTFAGFTGKVMYSFKGDSTAAGTENKADADRYAAAGLQYQAGAFTGVLTAEYTMWGNKTYGEMDDGVAVTLGGNYDFGVAKVFAKANYFDNAAAVEDTFKLKSGLETAAEIVLAKELGKDVKDVDVRISLKGWGAELGTDVPAFGGNIKAAVGYRDAKVAEDTNFKLERWNAGLGYTYAFSKRTNVYGAVAYAQEKLKGYGKSLTPNKVQAGFGLVHKF